MAAWKACRHADFPHFWRIVMNSKVLSALALSGLLAGGIAHAQEKVADLPKTQLQVVGALSNLTLYQNFEQPFWTKTVPELSNGQVTATIKGFTEMGLTGPEMLRLMSQGVIPVGTPTLAHFASGYPINEATAPAGLTPTAAIA